MKNILINILFILLPFSAISSPRFGQYFTDGALRFDYLLAGNNKTVHVFPVTTKREKFWSGSHDYLVDTLNLGAYRYRVFDKKSGKLIFSRGFAPLFQEWQTTPEAKKQERSFYQVLRFPFPQNEVKLEIDQRNWDGKFVSVFQTDVDPKNYFIINEAPEKEKVVDIVNSGKPENHVDIAILAEGYTADQMDKFVRDATRMTNYLFTVSPFSENKSKFNVYAVETPSIDSGTDIPGQHVYKNTAFNTTFYTFDVPRYLTTTDMKSVCDAAACVPYDQVIVLVNSVKYGGGGFYNFINVCTADHNLSKLVFVHEFGHGFAGLGDEYYTSTVAYEDYYNLKEEPWEPNLTTLVDFGKKWKDMVAPSTPIPTPRTPEYNNKVGAFEGGGYMSKGVYSPYENCRMKSNEASGFCPVCKRAITRVIDTYTK